MTTTTTLYRIDFSGRGLIPIDESTGDKNNLPVGTVLQLNGYSNPQYIITHNRGINPRFPAYGAIYDCLDPQTGDTIRKHAYALMWIGAKRDNRTQIYITDTILTPSEIEAATLRGQAAKREAEQAARNEAARRDAERARIIDSYPYLKQGTLTTTATANIRTELKRRYPGIKFTVRKTSHDAIRVGWTDGPIARDVEIIVSKYETGSFNGMEDIYEYNNNVWPDVFGGAKYIFADRTTSPALRMEAARRLGCYITSGDCDDNGNLPGLDWETSRRIYREADTIAR